MTSDSRPIRPKILVMGYARHGKDTVCELLRDHYGFSFVSSSQFCAEYVILPLLGPKYGYLSAKECFEDRGQHRAEWYDAIREFNRNDGTRLGRAIWERYDVYCGLRSAAEFLALRNKKVFDIVLWVDAGNRAPKEDESSCTVNISMAHYVIDNSSRIDRLEFNLNRLMLSLGIEKLIEK